MTASNEFRQTLHPKLFSLCIFCFGYPAGIKNQNIARSEISRVDRTANPIEHSDREAGCVHADDIMSLRLIQESGIVATIDVANRLVACINFLQQKCYIAVAARYGRDPAI